MPAGFLDNMDFEQYAKFVMKFPILFIQKKNNYIGVDSKNFGWRPIFEENNIIALKKKIVKLHLSLEIKLNYRVHD